MKKKGPITPPDSDIITFDEFKTVEKILTDHQYAPASKSCFSKIFGKFSFLRKEFIHKDTTISLFKKTIHTYNLFIVVVQSGPIHEKKRFVRFFVYHKQKIVSKVVTLSRRTKIHEQNLEMYESIFQNHTRCPLCGRETQIVDIINRQIVCTNTKRHDKGAIALIIPLDTGGSKKIRLLPSLHVLSRK